MNDPFLPELPEHWEDTRATLHAYALGVGAIPRAHAEAHPRWWHVSLTVVDKGLVTDEVPLAGGGTLRLLMDLTEHRVVLSTSGGDTHSFSIEQGLTATAFADRLIGTAAEYGLEGAYQRDKFENDDPRSYDRKAAGTFLRILVDVNAVFREHIESLDGEVSPVQMWPHGFDLAGEWFGTRVEAYEEDGEVTDYPSHLNLGFYPAGRPYFYSNPWPFEADALLGKPLPHGAEWHTDDWQGTILHYDQLADDAEAEQKLREYAEAVFQLTTPTLTA